MIIIEYKLFDLIIPDNFSEKFFTVEYAEYAESSTENPLSEISEISFENSDGLLCKPGYTGESCEDPCERDFYGENCTSECQCSHYGECSNVDGSCFCLPGCKEKLVEFKDFFNSP